MRFIKMTCFALIALLFLSFNADAERSTPLIVGHTDTNIHDIPDQWIDAAKANLHIAYQHTSHGSQLVSGIDTISKFSQYNGKYSWDDDGEGADGLDLSDYGIPGCPDLSQGDWIDGNGVTPWVTATRNLLDNPDNLHVNVIMWSWCDIGTHDIDRYLSNMEILIAEYAEGGTKPRADQNPVHFVFMTGHANGGGEDDSSDSRNKLIRAHCSRYNRILFDFADIENYDPDGNYFLDKKVEDGLQYTDENGVRQNWASQYLDRHSDSEYYQLTQLCDHCSHSPESGGIESPDSKLNCILKGMASWHLFARLAGWGECLNAPTNLTGPNEIGSAGVILDWDDNSDDPNEDQFIIQRQVNGGDWNDDYARVASGVTAYTDEAVDAESIYRYRVVAFLSDDGEGNSCTSTTSNIVTVPSDPDSDGDGTPDSVDECDADPEKTEAGECGCGVAETDTDDDNVPDCNDQCPEDPDKTTPGRCGCGELETDSDGDSLPDCIDDYPDDPDNGAGGENHAPVQPTPVSPADNATGVSLTPTLTAGSFQDPDAGDTHGSSQWQISTSDDFSQLVVDEQSESRLTSYTVLNDLDEQTTYYWRVRYYDSNDSASSWSEVYSFETDDAVDTPDPSGDVDDEDEDEEDDEITCFIGLIGHSFGMAGE